MEACTTQLLEVGENSRLEGKWRMGWVRGLNVRVEGGMGRNSVLSAACVSIAPCITEEVYSWIVEVSPPGRVTGVFGVPGVKVGVVGQAR